LPVGQPIEPAEEGCAQAGVIDGLPLVPELPLAIDADIRAAQALDQLGAIVDGRLRPFSAPGCRR
jgi:hypothetical protein